MVMITNGMNIEQETSSVLLATGESTNSKGAKNTPDKEMLDSPGTLQTTLN